ncbi:MAG: hypothetical protein NW214_07310, partial [Pseudanabaenaceae cyanobacterium bins.39]|nr:hypothetical protein [Pseudanabaenaceae cyanobacterium bins.39]
VNLLWLSLKNRGLLDALFQHENNITTVVHEVAQMQLLPRSQAYPERCDEEPEVGVGFPRSLQPNLRRGTIVL